MKQVELGNVVAWEGGRARSCARNVSKVTLTRSDLHKMATVRRKVQCILWLAKFESVTQVRREYRHVYNEEPPHENSIRRWDRQLKETGSILDKKGSGRPSVSDESVENIRSSFTHSPKKSVHKCA
jgi:hypothetical protein